MAQQKMQSTKYEILLCATKSFLERGYTDTYVTVVAKDLGISTGNLTFHYPTKEHRQSVLKEVMAMDYRSSGNHLFEAFCDYVEEKNSWEKQKTVKTNHR